MDPPALTLIPISSAAAAAGGGVAGVAQETSSYFGFSPLPTTSRFCVFAARGLQIWAAAGRVESAC